MGATSTNLLLLEVALLQTIWFIRPDRLDIGFLLRDRLLARTHRLFGPFSLQSFVVKVYVTVPVHLMGSTGRKEGNTKQERGRDEKNGGMQLIRLLKLKKASNMATDNHLVGSQHWHVGCTARSSDRQAILDECSTVIVAAVHHGIWVVVAVR